jgi:hypothetical protein
LIFQPAFTASPTNPKVTALGTIKWPNRPDLPPNTPPCGYDGKNPLCAPSKTKFANLKTEKIMKTFFHSVEPLAKGAIAAAAIIPTFLVLAAICVGYFFIRRFVFLFYCRQDSKARPSGQREQLFSSLTLTSMIAIPYRDRDDSP